MVKILSARLQQVHVVEITTFVTVGREKEKKSREGGGGKRERERERELFKRTPVQ